MSSTKGFQLVGDQIIWVWLIWEAQRAMTVVRVGYVWTVIRRPAGRASRSLVSCSTTMPPLSQWLRTCRNHCCHHFNRVLLTFSLVCAVQILLSSLNELTDELEFWNVQCSSELDDIAEDWTTFSFSISKSPTVISQNGRKL